MPALPSFSRLHLPFWGSLNFRLHSRTVKLSDQPESEGPRGNELGYIPSEPDQVEDVLRTPFMYWYTQVFGTQVSPRGQTCSRLQSSLAFSDLSLYTENLAMAELEGQVGLHVVLIHACIIARNGSSYIDTVH